MPCTPPDFPLTNVLKCRAFARQDFLLPSRLSQTACDQFFSHGNLLKLETAQDSRTLPTFRKSRTQLSQIPQGGFCRTPRMPISPFPACKKFLRQFHGIFQQSSPQQIRSEQVLAHRQPFASILRLSDAL